MKSLRFLTFIELATIFALGVSSGLPNHSAAEVTVSEPPLKVLTPKVIASYGRYSMRGLSISQGLGESVPGDGEVSIIKGSIRKIGSTRCIATITNTSDESTFSINFQISKFTKKTIDNPSKRLFSDTLEPNESVQREFSCDDEENLAVILNSGKELSRSG